MKPGLSDVILLKLQLAKHSTGASFPVGVSFDDKYKQIPIAATVEGSMSGIGFKNEYNFFEFRTVIEQRSDLYQARTLLLTHNLDLEIRLH